MDEFGQEDQLPFREVYDRWQRSKTFGDPRDLHQFSTDMNDVTQTKQFAQGQNAGWWRRASTAADVNVFEPTARALGLPQAGKAIGGLFGDPYAEAGERIGLSAPRAIAQTLPVIAAEFATGGLATPALLAGAATTGGLFGAQTYAETGSPGAAAISGATAAALPYAGKFGASLGLKAVGEEAGPALRKAGSFLGSQAGVVGGIEAGGALQAKAQGQPFDPLSPDFLAQQIPYTLLDLFRATTGKAPSLPRKEPPIFPEKRPYTPPEGTVEEQNNLSDMLDRVTGIAKDQNISPDEKAKAFSELVGLVQNPKAPVVKPDDRVILIGHPKAMDNGSIKLFTTQTKGFDLPEHSNVFVNPSADQTVFTNPDGSMTVITSRKNVNSNVKFPLGPNDFASLRGKGTAPLAPGTEVSQGEGVSPETDLLSLRQKFSSVVGNEDIFNAAVGKEPKDPAQAVEYWNQAIDRVTPEHLKPEYESPFDSGEQQALKEVGVDPSEVVQSTEPLELRAEDLIPNGNPANLRPAVKLSNGEVVTGEPGTLHHELYSHLPESEFVYEAANAEHGFQSPEKPFLSMVEGKATQQEARLKTSAQKIESSQQEIADTTAKLNTVPKDTQTALDLTDGNATAVKEHIDSGATPTQAVEKVRLQSETPKIDVAKQNINIAKDDIQEAVRKTKEPETRAGFLKDEKTGKVHKFVTSDAANAFMTKYQEKHPDLRFNLRVTKLRGKYQIRSAPREVSFEGKQGTSLENVIAAPTVETTTETIDVENLRDQLLQEAATTPIAESPEVSTPAEERPNLSFNDYLKQLDMASNAPSRMMNVGGFDDIPSTIQAMRQFRTALDVLKEGKTDVKSINAALKKAGMLPFADEAEMRDTFKQVRSGLEDFTQKYRSMGLDSEVPHDKELAMEMGIKGTNPLTNTLDWYIQNQPDSMLKELAVVLRKYSDFSHIDLTHNPDGFYYVHKDLSTSGRPRINLSRLAENRDEAIGDWGFTVVQELAHDSTADLMLRNDPAAVNFKADLARIQTALMESKQIPEKVRKVLKQSLKEDWYGKQNAGENFEEKYNKALPGQDHWKPVFYSLQNGHELVGGIYGSPKLIQLMKDTMMPKTSYPILNFFSEVWAQAFGASPHAINAFARLISSYDNYLSGTKMNRGYNGMSYIRDSILAEGVYPKSLASRMQTVNDTYSNGDLSASIKGFEREMKDGILPATIAAGPLNKGLKTALIQGDPATVRDSTLNLLVDELPQHQELLQRMKEDVRIARNLYEEAKKGNVPAELSVFQSGLKNQSVKLNAMERAMQKQAMDGERWKSLDALGNNDGIQRLWSASLKGDKAIDPIDQSGNEDVARQALGLEDPSLEFISGRRRQVAETGAKPLSWVDKMFKLASFTSEELPAFKPIYKEMHESQGNAQIRMTEFNMVKNSDPRIKGWSNDIANANRRVSQTPGLNRIVSDMLRRANVLEKQREPVTLDDPIMQEAIRRASDAKKRNGRSDRDDVVTAFNSEGSRSQHRVDKIVPEHLAKMNEKLTALAIIGREVGMPAEKALDLSRNLYTALAQLRDPAQAPQGAESLRVVAAQMQPDTFLKVLAQTNGFIIDAEKHIATLQRYRWYTGEQRYGDFHLVMSRDGEPLRESYNTEKAARARAKELTTDGWVLEDIVPKNRANAASLYGHDPVVASMQELDQQALNRLESVIADLPLEKQAAIRPLIERAADYEASSAAFSPVPTQASPRRKFVAGRETIDMIANADQESKRFVNWMRHRESRVGTAVHMLDPELLGNRPLREYSQQFVDNQLAADNPVARRLAEATFYWNLAGNLGVDFLHSIQTLTTGMASVIRETGNVGDALKYVTGASGKVAKRYVSGKWGDPKSEWFINWLTARGGLGLPAWGDIFDPTTMNYFQSYGPESAVGKSLNAIKQGVRGYKGIFLRHNDMVGGLAGFQLGLDKGMSLEDAARFGEGVKDRGFYSAGKVQRAVGFWSTKEKSIPQLFGALRTYTFGWFSQLSHYWKVGFANAPGDYTATQRQGAKQAFVYMLGAQAVLAGALGLPGVGQGLGLLKQTTGLDLKGWSRKNLAAMFGEDQDDYGGLMTGMAMHGLVSQFAPFDPSGRHIPNFPFIGVTPTQGFDISSLIPAPFTTAADIIGGLGAAGKGQDITRALPIIARGPIHLLQGSGDVRNSRGELLYNLSPGERVVTALGLEPTRVAAAKETARTVDSLNKAAAVKKDRFVDEVATLYRSGDTTNARKRLMDIGAQNPTYDMASFVRSVASAVEKQTIPYDWKREVNPAVDIVGLSSNQPSRELEREQLRRGVSAGLGLFERPNLRQQIHAASVDELMNADPYITRSAALQRLLTARQLQRRNILPEPVGYQ